MRYLPNLLTMEQQEQGRESGHIKDGILKYGKLFTSYLLQRLSQQDTA